MSTVASVEIETGTLPLAPGDVPARIAPRQASAALPPGTTVGRYLITGPLGAGGMSVVYIASDPELGRNVAIKLLRSTYWDADAQGRVLREAQAMAKLSHPNVVAIYDVGRFEGQVFIAMEVVDGVTLRDWLKQERRSWREIAAVFANVGRGLAAAHKVGLVHRDVKPANIMIDRAGRARIMDFGIARPMQTDDARSEPSALTVDDDPGVAEPSELHTPLTRAGAIVGTPGYMAPEQARGITDARTDQFGFFTTLHEALYGVRPTRAGESPPRDADLASGGAVRRCPGWLRATVLRGLRVEPELRHPSMDAVVAALTTDRGARRRVIIPMIAGLAAIATSIAFAATRGADATEPCRFDERRLVGTWDPMVAAAVKTAFVASGRPYGADTYARLAKVLDGRTSGWAAMHTDACAATRIRGEQSEQLLDLRMRCLDRALAETTQLTRLFATRVDPQIVDHAVEAALSLPTGAACADVEALSATVPAPTDPVIRGAVEAARAKVREAAALRRIGKYREGLAVIAPVTTETRSVAYAPLRAEVLVELAELQTRANDFTAAETTLYLALPAASAARDDRLLVRVLSRLVYVLGYQQSRPAEARALDRVVEAMLVRIGDDPELRAKAYHARAATEFAQARYGDALHDFERVLAIYGANQQRDPRSYANALSSVSATLGELGRNAEAVGQLERARTLLVDALGPSHPEVAEIDNNLGWVYMRVRRYADARAAYLRALATHERALGHRDATAVVIENNLGELDLLEHHPADAEHRCRDTLAIAEAIDVAGEVIGALACIGNARLDLGDATGAIAPLERALAMRDTSSADPGDVAEIEFALARALWSSGHERSRAVVLADRARGAFTALGMQRREDLERVDAWRKARVR